MKYLSFTLIIISVFSVSANAQDNKSGLYFNQQFYTAMTSDNDIDVRFEIKGRFNRFESSTTYRLYSEPGQEDISFKSAYVILSRKLELVTGIEQYLSVKNRAISKKPIIFDLEVRYSTKGPISLSYTACFSDFDFYKKNIRYLGYFSLNYKLF